MGPGGVQGLSPAPAAAVLTCPCSRAPPSRPCPRGLRLSSQPRALLKVWFYVSAQYSRRRICGQAGPPFSQPRAQRLFPGPRAPGAPHSDRPPPFQRPELQPAARVPRGHPDAGPPAGTVSATVGSGLSSVSAGPHALTSQGRDPLPPGQGSQASLLGPERLQLGRQGSWALPAWKSEAGPAWKAWEWASFVPWGPSSAPTPGGDDEPSLS